MKGNNTLHNIINIQFYVTYDVVTHLFLYINES